MDTQANYRGIEGLRGILAWAVFFSHVPLQTAIGSRLIGNYQITKAGTLAVEMFIIISGFVITHLVLSRDEPYRTYLLRRAFRLYPAYLVCLGLGIAIQPFELHFLTHLPWEDDPHGFSHLALQATEMQIGHGPLHLLLHLSLLHGMIPEQLLDEGIFMFLPPGWSLSLEWQFYLVAPLVIGAVIRAPVASFILFAATTLAYKAGVFGHFALPSFLPGAILYFAIGIATRLAFRHIEDFERIPILLILAALAPIIISTDFVFVSGWIVMAIYMKTRPQKQDVWFDRMSAVLDSSFMQAVGARSYSVYLVHWPVVAATASFAVAVLKLGAWGTYAFTLIAGFILTALLSDQIYRHVEKPGIRLGHRLANRFRQAA